MLVGVVSMLIAYGSGVQAASGEQVAVGGVQAFDGVKAAGGVQYQQVVEASEKLWRGRS